MEAKVADCKIAPSSYTSCLPFPRQLRFHLAYERRSSSKENPVSFSSERRLLPEHILKSEARKVVRRTPWLREDNVVVVSSVFFPIMWFLHRLSRSEEELLADAKTLIRRFRKSGKMM
jgi:hypothetical protein